MAGFFGLFGKKEDGPKDAYFLSSDDSKTYGDIEYMRTSKTIRRTFVKTVGNPEGGETFNTVSSENQVKGNANQAKTITSKGTSNSFAQSTQTSTSEESTSTPTPTYKPGDDGLDMFRNMAKQVRGRK